MNKQTALFDPVRTSTLIPGFLTLLALFATATVLTLGACTPDPLQTSDTLPAGYGRIILNLSTDALAGSNSVASSLDASRNTFRPTVGNITSYRITPSNGPEVVNPVTTGTGTVSLDLPEGTWDLLVEGLGTNGIVLYSGAVAAQSLSGATATLSLTLAYQVLTGGSGTVNLAISWPAGSGVDQVTAGFALRGGTGTPSDLTINGNTATLSGTYPSGTYLLTLALYRNGNLAYQKRLDILHVLDGTVTSGRIDYGKGDAIPVPGVSSPVRISSRGNFNLLIKADGSLWAWGDNDYGQLGQGTTTKSSLPLQVGAETNWTSVAAGTTHSLAIQADGTLWAWGYNYDGELGLGDTTDRHIPTRVGNADNWTRIASGEFHNLAIKADGTLWAWGLGGGLGQADSNDRSSPTQVGSDTDWVAVSCGENSSYALKANGTLWAWGTNDQGQLGLGDTTFRYTPVQVGSSADWASVEAGALECFAIKIDGTLWAWGTDNSSGRLGLGSPVTDKTAPVQVGSAADWVAVSAGFDHTLAMNQDGAIFVTGSNSTAQLGDFSTSRTTFTRLPTSQDWALCEAGLYHSLAVKNDGSLWSWGDNTSGQLGLGTNAFSEYITPNFVSSGWKDLRFWMGIKTDGSLWTWGNNAYGQLGQGDTVNRALPTRVGTGTWKSIISSVNTCLALKTDGTLWLWGFNGTGQVGNGNTSNVTAPYSPTTLKTFTDWKEVHGGLASTYAIRNNGYLYAWGNNNYGQLGIGSYTYNSNPTMITTSSWKTLVHNSTFTLAIKTDGTLWAWGRNTDGQLGLGDTTTRTSPVQVGTDTDWAALSTKDMGNSSLALKADGSLWAWGLNADGQLGLGDTTSRLAPTRVGTDTDWKAFCIRTSSVMALKNDGSLWAWGNNTCGCLGLGDTVDHLSPTRIGSANDWAEVPSPDLTVMAKKTDGSLWGWGQNSEGQLGTGNFTEQHTPQKIGNDSDWTLVNYGSSSTLALKNDGSFWAWGNNNDGALAIPGNHEPTQVLGPSPVTTALVKITLTNSTAPLTLSTGGKTVFSKSDTLTVSITEPCDSFAWYLAGVQVSGATGSSLSLNLSTLNYGTWRITVVASKNGILYSRDLYFTVGA